MTDFSLFSFLNRIPAIAILCVFSGLFHVTLISQSTENCFYLVGALSLMLPIKPDKLNLAEQNSSLLPEELKQKLGFGNDISDTWLQWFIPAE